MENNLYIPLTNRVLLAISGDDARQFLQGLITNDINKVNSKQGIYALMLTPQGKFLYDFFIYEHESRLLLDCNILKIEEIKKKLSMYKLRSKVIIEDISGEYEIVAISGKSKGLEAFYSDPRSPSLPSRVIIKNGSGYNKLEESGLIKGKIEDYETIRISLCIPADIDMADSFPLEYEMDKHNAIDYEKGCYVGQEVTARTHYRGTLRKKPYLVTSEGNIDLSEYIGQEITAGNNKTGIIRSAIGNQAIAIFRMEELEKSSDDLMVGLVKLKVVN